MATKKVTVKLTEEEVAIINRLREGKSAAEEVKVEKDSLASAHKQMADAFVEAIERTKPPVKITIANRKPRTPWTPPDGTPVVKLKRKFFHHSLPIDERLDNKEKELLNQIKPGRYCDGFVIVSLRKDRGIDIDYPVKTASQRLQLVNKFGVTSFAGLLERVIDERVYPAKYRRQEDKDLYDID